MKKTQLPKPKSKKNPKLSRIDHLDKEYDLIIIGGGITGANVLWDATLRGFKCLLVEKSDYASGTSQATSKLIHGGLRYLKNLEFSLVRESLKERRVLAKIGPHSVRPLGFIIPIHSFFERIVLWAGMLLYNFLSFDRNQEIVSDTHIPRFIWNSKSETIYKSFPLSRNSLIGSYQYYDYMNINPEYHTCEFIFSAKARGAHALNYTNVNYITKQYSGGYSINVSDTETGKERTVSAKVVVNCAGPWADIIEAMAGISTEKKILRSKGIHAVVRNICSKECIILKKKDGSHLFVIPWRNQTIIGTTDTIFDNHPDSFEVTESEIKNLLDEVNSSFGLAPLKLDDVVYYYGGLRPLVEDADSKKETYSASRKSEIMNYTAEGFAGFFSALGGKYTTSRNVSEKLMDQVSFFLKKEKILCQSDKQTLLGGDYMSRKELVEQLTTQFPNENSLKLETLAGRYGRESFRILLLSGKEKYQLPNGELLYEEEIDYAVKFLDILHATDFYFRRSGAGTVGKINAMDRKKIDEKLAKGLGWDMKRARIEASLVDKRYEWAK